MAEYAENDKLDGCADNYTIYKSLLPLIVVIKGPIGSYTVDG